MPPTILVTGDVVLDHNIYVGKRLTPSSSEPGTTTGLVPGGAMLSYGLLRALAGFVPDTWTEGEPKISDADLAFGLQQTSAADLLSWPSAFHAGALWEPIRSPGSKDAYWRVTRKLGLGSRDKPPKSADSAKPAYPASPAAGLDEVEPRILVIDDGAMGFRLQSASQCWPKALDADPERSKIEWIILKMAGPLGRGDLWTKLVQKWKDKLIVVITAGDLRREDVMVARGLSWEKTVDDLLGEVSDNPALTALQKCKHLVIALRGDAGVWLADPGAASQQCRLVFDRYRGEGEWDEEQGEGTAVGFLSAMTASLAWRLWYAIPGETADLVPALQAGLSAARVLRSEGHGPEKADGNKRSYPFQKIAAELRKPEVESAGREPKDVTQARHAYASTTVPPQAGKGEFWTILSHSLDLGSLPREQLPTLGPARRLALFGPAALPGVPCAKFGKVTTVDRREIEVLRSLRQQMLRYKNSGPQKQPLSLAVFGAPGSGKSFSLKQIAEGVFGSKNPILEFNLSQFKGPEDLIGAYHQVRDKVLQGFTPVAFWDEFDSGNYKWLQYMLAPMQDGIFLEGQISHPIGKSIFVFAGGTSCDFEHFGPPEKLGRNKLKETKAQREARVAFVMAKGPDFRSRISGYLDVPGPNPRRVYSLEKARLGEDPWQDDPKDIEYPIRRAILLRALLGYVGDKENAVMRIDPGLLTAMLEITHYCNGARSMEKLVAHLTGSGEPPSRTQLPHDRLLDLFVEDVPGFHGLLRRYYQFQAKAERLARSIHQNYVRNLTDAQRQGNESAVSWEELTPELRASNVAAAMRIPEILAVVGRRLAQGRASAGEEREVRGLLKNNLELLARMEHDGWQEQKRKDGWTYSPVRNDDLREHDLLIPYDRLPEEQKDKDRQAIRDYPDLARLAGFRIVRPRRSGLAAQIVTS
jgi:hypothetical protein